MVNRSRGVFLLLFVPYSLTLMLMKKIKVVGPSISAEQPIFLIKLKRFNHLSIVQNAKRRLLIVFLTASQDKLL